MGRVAKAFGKDREGRQEEVGGVLGSHRICGRRELGQEEPLATIQF